MYAMDIGYVQLQYVSTYTCICIYPQTSILTIYTICSCMCTYISMKAYNLLHKYTVRKSVSLCLCVDIYIYIYLFSSCTNYTCSKSVYDGRGLQCRALSQFVKTT